MIISFNIKNKNDYQKIFIDPLISTVQRSRAECFTVLFFTFFAQSSQTIIFKNAPFSLSKLLIYGFRPLNKLIQGIFRQKMLKTEPKNYLKIQQI